MLNVRPCPSEVEKGSERPPGPAAGRRARKDGAALRKRLPEYEAKRDFAVTPEPAPGTAKTSAEQPSFVVHKHDATRLHYDVRLELDGALFDPGRVGCSRESSNPAMFNTMIPVTTFQGVSAWVLNWMYRVA